MAAPERGQQKGLPGRDLLYPKYAIHNKAAYLDSWNAAEGGISNKTVNTDVIHQNGLAEYDVHNLYGSSKHFSEFHFLFEFASQKAVLSCPSLARLKLITKLDWYSDVRGLI